MGFAFHHPLSTIAHAGEEVAYPRFFLGSTYEELQIINHLAQRFAALSLETHLQPTRRPTGKTGHVLPLKIAVVAGRRCGTDSVAEMNGAALSLLQKNLVLVPSIQMAER
jgi:hypothetical protein